MAKSFLQKILVTAFFICAAADFTAAHGDTLIRENGKIVGCRCQVNGREKVFLNYSEYVFPIDSNVLVFLAEAYADLTMDQSDRCAMDFISFRLHQGDGLFFVPWRLKIESSGREQAWVPLQVTNEGMSSHWEKHYILGYQGCTSETARDLIPRPPKDSRLTHKGPIDISIKEFQEVTELETGEADKDLAAVNQSVVAAPGSELERAIAEINSLKLNIHVGFGYGLIQKDFVYLAKDQIWKSASGKKTKKLKRATLCQVSGTLSSDNEVEVTCFIRKNSRAYGFLPQFGTGPLWKDKEAEIDPDGRVGNYTLNVKSEDLIPAWEMVDAMLEKGKINPRNRLFRRDF